MLEVMNGGRAIATSGKPSYAIVPAEVHHVYELAVTLREADRTEILNMGYPVKKALWRAFRNSVLCRTALVGGYVAAMWGLAIGWRTDVSPLSDLGVPWLHTSAAIEALPVAFIRESRKQVAAMRKLRPRLESHVAVEYLQAIKFIRMMGFTVEKPQPIGLNGARFCRFHMGFDA